MIYYLPVEGILAQPLLRRDVRTTERLSTAPLRRLNYLMRPDALNLIYCIEKKYPVFIPPVGEMYPKAEHEKGSQWK